MPIKTTASWLTATLLMLTGGAEAWATPISYSGAITSYTITVSGFYDITAAGAQGGAGSLGGLGGLGALAGGDIYLNQGTILDVVVGGAGHAGPNIAGGGGGGSFVYDVSGLLVAAGGGGGGAYQGANGGVGQSGTAGETGLGTAGGAGGINGGGGTFGGVATGGGAGWLGNGISDVAAGYATEGGQSAPSFNGGFGTNALGGFGGGGTGGEPGGGGGGYSGGGGGGPSGSNSGGGGGGSFLNSGFTNTELLAGDNAGNGFVSIDFVSSAVPEPASLSLISLGLLAFAAVRRKVNR
jgi:hypothetical protein